jgi:DNA polymerase
MKAIKGGGGIDTLIEVLMQGDYGLVEAMYGPAVDTVLSSLRHVICAPGDNLLSAGDFSQIEARIVLALAGQHDKTAMLAAGMDPYCDNASQVYGRKITKTDVEERQIGKNSVLGLGFQMGALKYFARYCPNKSLEFAQHVVNVYRKEWAPEVPKLWGALGWASTETVWTGEPHEEYGVEYRLEDIWLTARLPSGRKLWYPFPEKTRRAMPWDANDVRPGWSYRVRKAGKIRRVHAFGGLLTENVVQALARDVMVPALIKCKRENVPVILTVHDEVVTEQGDEKLLHQIMLDVPDWVRHMGVPIAAETWSGRRYKK